MKKWPYIIAAILIVLLIVLGVTSECDRSYLKARYTLKFIVYHPPRNLQIDMVSQDINSVSYSSRVYEGYLIFNFDSFSNDNELNIGVIGNGTAFTITVNPPDRFGDTFYTVNFDTHKVTPGRSPLPSILLTLLRVGLIIILEAILLWSVNLEDKKSWRILLGITVISQVFVNLYIDLRANIVAEEAFFITLISIYLLIIFNLIAIPLFFKKEQNQQEEILHK